MDSGKVRREDLFITSKLWNTNHAKQHVREACLKTLKDLQLDYLDLYLIHWPVSFEYVDMYSTSSEIFPHDEEGNVRFSKVSLWETWLAMEKLVDEGLVRSIGVSNMNVALINDLLTYARIMPAICQVELHPYLVQENLVSFLHERGIHVTAYSPLGRGKNLLTDPKVQEISRRYNKTPAQVLIRWAIDRGLMVIPKSVHQDRLKENFDVFNFKLTSHDLDLLKQMNKNERFVNFKDLAQVDIFA